MGEVINLNKVRKALAKAEGQRKAAENRAAKGVSKVAKTRMQIELEKARKALDAHKRED